MTGQYISQPNDVTSCNNHPVEENLRAALALLRQTYEYARDADVDLWEFALEIGKLYETGLTISDLRWLVAKGFAAHGRETSEDGEPHRSFRPGDGLKFESTTCFVLTPCGCAFANGVDGPAKTPQSTTPTGALLNGGASDAQGHVAAGVEGDKRSDAQKPHWDLIRRELTLNGVIVKRFRVPARNQELILCAFEEQAWPQHIDDPLPVGDDIDPHTRLHDALNRLNRRQTHPLIRFRGNGNGTGVWWELRNSQ